MLLGSASLEELLSRVTSELRRIVPYDVLSVYGLDEVRGLLVPLHCARRRPLRRRDPGGAAGDR